MSERLSFYYGEKNPGKQIQPTPFPDAHAPHFSGRHKA